MSNVVRSRLHRKHRVTRHRSDSGWCHQLTGAFGVSAVMVALWYPFSSFFGIFPQVLHSVAGSKSFWAISKQSGALWASTEKTGSTSLAAAALASCLPWIGTSRDCWSLWACLNWRLQPRSWNSCVCNCCVWQRTRFCCEPRFWYPRDVCGTYLLSALGRWMRITVGW